MGSARVGAAEVNVDAMLVRAGSRSLAQLRSFLFRGFMTSRNSASVDSSFEGFALASDPELFVPGIAVVELESSRCLFAGRSRPLLYRCHDN